jgi:hypothetical protein
MVEHGLLEGHRDLVLRAEPDRGVDLLLVLDQRQLHGPHDDPLVGDPEANGLAELVVGEQGAQRLRERLGVLHLALIDNTGRERRDRGAADLTRAVRTDLGGGDAAGLDVEADDGLSLLGGEHWLV